MNEQELRDENERLRRGLAEATKSRDRLREMICAILPVEPPDVIEKEIEEMMSKPARGIDDIIEELRRGEVLCPQKKEQIPA